MLVFDMNVILKISSGKLVLLSFLLFLSFSFTQAQVKTFGVGGNLGANMLFGDSRIVNSRIDLNYGFYGLYRTASRLSYKLQIGFGKFGYYRSGSVLKTEFVPVELTGIYALTSNPDFTPFLTAGFGLINYSLDGSEKKTAGMLIGGGGVIAPISSQWSFLFSADMRYTTEDNFNNINLGLKDAYLSFQSGLLYYFKESPQNYKRKKIIEEDKIVAEEEIAHHKDRMEIKNSIENLKNESTKRDYELQEIKNLVISNEKKIDLISDGFGEIKKIVLDLIAQKQPSELNVKQKYIEALYQFEERNYKEAMQNLVFLSENHQNHPLYYNFIYWIGECCFGMGNYESALNSFEQLIKYPNSKVDDALIMQGISYKRIGNESKAKQKFAELIRKYPNSEFADKAEKNLKSY